MAHMKLHARLAQPVQPGAQQRRGLHIGGENAAGTADEGVNAKCVDPCAYGSRVELRQPRRYRILARAVARHKCGIRLGMGDVHAALAGQQKLASDRRHGVIHGDPHPALAEQFCRHQAGRTAANDSDMGMFMESGHGIARAGNDPHCSRFWTGKKKM
jgi:hypothetical protein